MANQTQFESSRVRSSADIERIRQRAREYRFDRDLLNEESGGRSPVPLLVFAVVALGLVIACSVDAEVGRSLMRLARFL